MILIFKKVIDTFPGVPNRIEYIGKFKGAKIYNDSKSTNIFSSLSALKSFAGKKVLILLGGQIRSSGSINVSGIRDII